MTALPAVAGSEYPSRPDPLEQLPALIQLADRIADTEFVPRALRNRPAAVLAALLTAADLGLPVTTGLRSISVIDGKPSLSAEVMRALVLAAGHSLEIVESTPTRCEMRARRAGDDEWSRPVVWDLERAEVAGLAAKENWRKYPTSMLLARCSTDICRALFPDVIAGLPGAEEVEDYGDAGPGGLSHPAPSIDVSSAPAADSGAAALAPPPALTPNEDDTRRRNRHLHAELHETFPHADPAQLEVLRGALVALVTRKRPGGSVLSSIALTPAETVLALTRLSAIRTGRESMTVEPDGLVTYRAGPNVYRVDLEPSPPVVVRIAWATGDPEGEP